MKEGCQSISCRTTNKTVDQGGLSHPGTGQRESRWRASRCHGGGAKTLGRCGAAGVPSLDRSPRMKFRSTSSQGGPERETLAEGHAERRDNSGQGTHEAGHVLTTPHTAGVTAARFGFHNLGLIAHSHLLASADVGLVLRRPPLPGCIRYRNHANCLTCAVQWRTRVLSRRRNCLPRTLPTRTFRHPRRPPNDRSPACIASNTSRAPTAAPPFAAPRRARVGTGPEMIRTLKRELTQGPGKVVR